MRSLLPLVFVAIAGAWAQPTAGVRPGEDLLGFTLDEQPAAVGARLGPPAQTGALGPGYFSWFYQVDVHDLHEFSHILCFREPDRKLVSITRQFDPEVTVDHLFPAGATKVQSWPDRLKPQFRVRIRHLAGDRLLLAMGSEAGRPCGQLVLIRRTAARFFFPWLDTATSK